MHHQIYNIKTSGCILVILFMLAGCGEQKSAEQVGSFSEGVTLTAESVDSTSTLATAPTLSNDNSKKDIVSYEQMELQTESTDIHSDQSVLLTPQVSKEDKSKQSTPTSIPPTIPTEQVSKQQQEQKQEKQEQKVKEQKDQQLTSTQAITINQSINNEESIPTPTKKSLIEQVKPTSAPNKETTKSKYQSISWNGFFDNEEQNTPSDDFWDLSEAKSTVQIKGFMGEILSLDKNWFLLIPEPGAECPFDNGDETYWNKIMIVYVEDKAKLRYTSKPLQITGRLDVGVKVDESGYKTMFRLYDAKFEEIKE